MDYVYGGLPTTVLCTILVTYLKHGPSDSLGIWNAALKLKVFLRCRRSRQRWRQWVFCFSVRVT